MAVLVASVVVCIFRGHHGNEINKFLQFLMAKTIFTIRVIIGGKFRVGGVPLTRR
jgi:methylmalonyl-CoA mutase cobalamin-binding subunit